MSRVAKAYFGEIWKVRFLEPFLTLSCGSFAFQSFPRHLSLYPNLKSSSCASFQNQPSADATQDAESKKEDTEFNEELAWDIKNSTTAEMDVKADRAPEKSISDLQKESVERVQRGDLYAGKFRK